MMAVMSNPIKRPVKGFEVASMIVSAAVFPRFCREEIMRSRANRKIKSAARMNKVFLTIILQRLSGGGTSSSTDLIVCFFIPASKISRVGEVERN